MIWASQFKGNILGSSGLVALVFWYALPRSAPTLVPHAHIRKPSFLMSMVALMSLSCRDWQWGQSNPGTDRSIFGIGNKVFEQICDEGKNLPTSRSTFPSVYALYLSMVQNIPLHKTYSQLLITRRIYSYVVGSLLPASSWRCRHSPVHRLAPSN